jgi:hypothetical protein
MRKRFACLRPGLAGSLWVLLMMGPAWAASAPDASPMPADRAANSYAIYSMLIPGELMQGMPPEQKQRLAIADTTVSIADMSPAVAPDAQLKPPAEGMALFRAVLQDYEARRYQRVRLTRGFHLNQDYALLTSEQVNEIQAARGSVYPGSDLRTRYTGYPGIIFLSQVFFNPRQTAALVYVSEWCANLCASGTWVYLEKQGNTWVRRSGTTAQP